MSSETKEVTVEVPAERVPEFYAWYGRFLAGPRGRRRRHAHEGHGCGPRRQERSEPEETREV